MPVEFFSSVGTPKLKSVELQVFTSTPQKHILVYNTSPILSSALTPIPDSSFFFFFLALLQGLPSRGPQGSDLLYNCILPGLDDVFKCWH